MKIEIFTKKIRTLLFFFRGFYEAYPFFTMTSLVFCPRLDIIALTTNQEPLPQNVYFTYMTGAGVSAGIDMALTLAAKIAGPQFAQALQVGIEYDPEPPFDRGSPLKANSVILEAVYARMSDLFEKEDF